MIKKISFFAVILSILVMSVNALALSEAEKAERREELNAHFSEVITRIEGVKAPVKKSVFRLTGNASSKLGFDSNVDLTSNEDEDVYYREYAAGRVEYDSPDLHVLDRQITLGADAKYYYHGYFDRDDLNRQGGELTPYLKFDLIPSVHLRGGYSARLLDYDEQELLNYFSQAGTLEVVHDINKSFSHRAEFRYEELRYDDRKSLTTTGTFTDDDREDDRYYFAYQINHRFQNIRWRMKASWMDNDSNDEFIDYNDYKDFGLDGSASLRTFERWIFTAFGGWHNREYDNRTPLNTSSAQEDDWYYYGGRIFFLINSWAGVDITLTFTENDSNDPNHEYDRVTAASGLHLFF